MDLSFCTTQELLEEVSRRATFAGIIVQATVEAKNFPTEFNNWEITYANLTETQAKELLEDAAEHFRELATNSDE